MIQITAIISIISAIIGAYLHARWVDVDAYKIEMETLKLQAKTDEGLRRINATHTGTIEHLRETLRMLDSRNKLTNPPIERKSPRHETRLPTSQTKESPPTKTVHTIEVVQSPSQVIHVNLIPDDVVRLWDEQFGGEITNDGDTGNHQTGNTPVQMSRLREAIVYNATICKLDKERATALTEFLSLYEGFTAP